MTPFGEESGAAKVFGETPKTAVGTTALPPKQLNRSGLVVSAAIGCASLQFAATACNFAGPRPSDFDRMHRIDKMLCVKFPHIPNAMAGIINYQLSIVNYPLPVVFS